MSDAGALEVRDRRSTPPARKGNHHEHGLVRQDWLVNVSITDTDIQLSISVAANVCGIAVDVFATPTGTAPAECDAQGSSRARHR